MRLIVMGYGGHGKDEACKIIRDEHGLDYMGSSWAACIHVVYPVLRDKYNYQTPEECYADRSQHRGEWFELILAYNSPHRYRLGSDIYSKVPVYCGIRSREEFEALQERKMFDYSIWVDRSDFEPPEGADSNQMLPFDADCILDNNGTLDHLRAGISTLINTLKN